MLQITFQTAQIGVLGQLHSRVNATSTAVDSVLQTATDEWLAFLTVSDLDSNPADAVKGVPTVNLLRSTAYTSDSGTFVLLVQVAGDPCIVQTLAQHRAIPHTVHLRNQQLEGSVTVEDWDHLQTIASEIENTHGEFDLVSVNQVDHMDAMLGSDQFKLAIRQRLPAEHLRTLEVAYNTGYFDVPQSASASEVADELGVSQSTFSERFRRAATSLLRVIFGDQAEMEKNLP